MRTTLSVTTPADLGKLVHKARKAQGLTQDALAGLTGTGRRFIVDLESGKPTAHVGKVLHVLRTLGIALSATYAWQE